MPFSEHKRLLSIDSYENRAHANTYTFKKVPKIVLISTKSTAETDGNVLIWQVFDNNPDSVRLHDGDG